QSSHVPNLLPDDPYVAVRQSHFVDKDTKSEPVKDLRETEAHIPTAIDTESEPEEAPSETEEFEASNPSDTKITSLHSSASSDSTEPLSPDHPLTQTSPTLTPTRVSFHRRTARMTLVKDTEEESLDLGTKRKGSEEEGPGSEDEGHGLKDEGHGLKEEEEEAAPKGEAKMRRTFEVGQSSRSVLEHKGAERISAFRQPTLVTWVDPKDGRVYTDILTYVPPAAPVQTPPSLEWLPGSLYNTPCFRVIGVVNKFTMYF
ncbi:hypothetical protein Tco_1086358, partial [Tanacetum coccineum]